MHVLISGLPTINVILPQSKKVMFLFMFVTLILRCYWWRIAIIFGIQINDNLMTFLADLMLVMLCWFSQFWYKFVFFTNSQDALKERCRTWHLQMEYMDHIFCYWHFLVISKSTVSGNISDGIIFFYNYYDRPFGILLLLFFIWQSSCRHA